MDFSGDEDQLDSAELFDRSCCGDEEALSALVVREMPWIRARVRSRISKLIRIDGDTGDIVQDIVVQLLRAGTPVPLRPPEAVRAYLATVTVHTLHSCAGRHLTQKRAATRRQSMASDAGLSQLVDSATSPEDHAMRTEDIEWMEAGLDLMAGPEQDLIWLHLRDGLTFVEIGERLGIKTDAARRRFGRAVGKLGGIVKRLRAGRVAELLIPGD